MELGEKFLRLRQYLTDVYRESKRITWTSRKESLKGTYAVLVIVIVSALFLALVDIGLARLIHALFKG
jgi:preprotein translocase subunit SecE